METLSYCSSRGLAILFKFLLVTWSLRHHVVREEYFLDYVKDLKDRTRRSLRSVLFLFSSFAGIFFVELVLS